MSSNVVKMYVYTYIHIYTCMHVHTYIHMHTHIYMYACMYTHTYICMQHTYMHACPHVHTHTYMYACIHANIYTHDCTHEGNMFDIEKMKERANKSKWVIGWRVMWKRQMRWGQGQ